jgi:hypothetical protein
MLCDVVMERQVVTLVAVVHGGALGVLLFVIMRYDVLRCVIMCYELL